LTFIFFFATVATLAEEVIDIDQLPVAPANKRKGSKHGGSA